MSLKKKVFGLGLGVAGALALFWSLSREGRPETSGNGAGRSFASAANASRDAVRRLVVDEFPAGTMAGELVLFFENQAARDAFWARMKKQGGRVLGVIPALNAVRIATNGTIDFSAVASMPLCDFNFSVRVPAVSDDAMSPEARESAGGGRVPVGNAALAQMHASAESLGASAAGNGVKVALLDTGIYAAHAVFEGVKITQIDVAGGAADTAESLAHGTAVASLIVGNGSGEVSGLASSAELLSVRVFDGEGNATAFSLAEGIVAAVDAGANIINLSAGLTADSAVLRAAVEYAREAGVTLVASAGNEGVKSLAFPAAYEGVIAVGAVDGAGTSAPFSNVGENLSVVAPGVAVYAAGSNSTEGVVDFSGTSASAPLVTGALAAALSNAEGNFDAQKITETADDFGVPGHDEEYGFGIVNYERLTRPTGVGVTDVSVNDFYLRAGSGGNTGISLGATLQNRGTLWENCTFSLTITFSDGTLRIANGVLNLGPGESVGQSLSLTPEQLSEGVRADAEIRDSAGNIISGKSAFLKKR